MRTVTSTTANRWAARIKIGDGRAWARATIQPLILQKWSGPGFDIGDKNNTYTSMVFGQPHDLREIPNIKSINITRNVDSDAQVCIIELTNTLNIPIGTVIDSVSMESEERPGWFSFGRGSAGNPWGHAQNSWYGWIVPDRIIRTYEGYGINPSVAADKDENMYPSGVWLIDTVTVTPDGGLRVECRDLARELLEQMLFLPVVPKDYYPLVWERKHGKPHTVYSPQGLFPLEYEKDSNLPYIGKGLTDGGKPYVQPNGSVRGHNGRDAFDGDKKSYWMSVGNQSRSSTSAYEWVQGLTPGAVHMEGVQVKAWGGPYTVYISVKRGGEWSGKPRIGYKANLVDAHSDIHYVKAGQIAKGETKVFKIPAKYQDGVEAVRVTLHHLYDSNVGSFPYRGGIYDVRWTPSITAQEAEDLTGNYDDYTDIVTTLLAWGGFYWPRAASGRSYLRSTDGTTTTYAQAEEAGILAQGNVWGDLQKCFVGGAAQQRFESTTWDKKPIADAINYIKDLVAFTFFIDETGAAIFRLPNIWQLGNYLAGDGGPNAGRTGTIIELEDTDNLLANSLRLSSLNRRDRVFVSTKDGKMGAVVKGYDPYPSGTRRISGWTDTEFTTEEEVVVMAHLIATRQALKMQSATITIMGNPAIQIDDQVLVRERVTGMNHLFYVAGIVNNYDALTGRYTYDLTLQWLGDENGLLTGVLPAGSDAMVQAYLDAIFHPTGG